MMTKAFALAKAASTPVQRDSEPRNVSFAMWDQSRASRLIDDGLKALRREHLKKYVTAAMGASLLILIVAMVRFAVGGDSEEEVTRAATFAKMREVPAEIAALPRQISTLSTRTQAALKLERKRDVRAATHMTARSKYW
jgi:hypothetical protein